MVKRPSDLFTTPDSPAVVKPAAKPSATNPLGTLLIVALVGFLIYLTLTRMDWGGNDQDRDDQHHEQKDDKKKHDDKKQVVAAPGWLHIVRERQDPPIEQQEAVVKVFEFCEQAKKQDIKLEMRDSDEEDDTPAVRKMIEHAKSKGIDPPFMLYKTQDNELRGVIKMPATGSDSEVLEVFK